MPAHIYIRTGQYAKSAKSNADAAAVDEKYFKDDRREAVSIRRCITATTCSSSPRRRCMPATSRKRASAAQRTVKLADPIADQMVMIEPFAAQELAVLVRFGQWPAILETKAPAATRLMQSALYHFAHGAALAATGKAAEAEADLAALKARGQDAEGRDGRRRRIPPLMSPPSRSRTSPRASPKRRATRRPRSRDSRPRWRLEDRLGYNEPPDWLNPERERLGAVLLKAGRFADAEKRVPRRSGEEHR